MNFMDAAAVGYQIVFTKWDKVKALDMENLFTRTHDEIAKHVAAHPDIIATSSFKAQGLEPLRATLASIARMKESKQII